MAEIITKEYVHSLLGERDKCSHKGSNGRGLVLSGSEGMAGAALMCSAAALRAGIGILKVLTAEAAKPVFSALPEAMVRSIPDWEGCNDEIVGGMIGDADCIAVGPGMGKGEGVLNAVCAAINSGKPTVIDADGLNAVSAAKRRPTFHEKIVLTPHIGEMSRLTGAEIAEISADMEGFALKYAKEWGCTVLLKSAQSVIADASGSILRNVNGNPGLAKGGSGDVLCGLTLALLGQGLCAFDAACAASYLLGASADAAVELLNVRMLMARDVIDMVKCTVDSVFK